MARRGVTDLARAARLEVLAVTFALFTAEAIRTVQRVGGKWSLENPKSSRLWSFDPIFSLSGLKGARVVHFTVCAYGDAYKYIHG